MATPVIAGDVRIEPGTFENLDSVVQVMERAFGSKFGEAWSRSQLAGILPMTGVTLKLAADRHSDETVGFTLCRTVCEEAELLLIAVRPSHHRQGIGRKLLRDFMERARAEGVKRVHLEVRDGNRAMEMYRAAGFSPIGRRRNYYVGADGKRYDAITLAQNL